MFASRRGDGPRAGAGGHRRSGPRGGAARRARDRALGASGGEIVALEVDERAWEARVDAFHYYHNLWRTRGFAPMVRELMRREDVARTPAPRSTTASGD